VDGGGLREHGAGEGGEVVGAGRLRVLAECRQGLGLVEGELDGGHGRRRGQVLAGASQGAGVVEAAVDQGPEGQQLDGLGGQLAMVGLAGQAEGGVAVGLGRLPVAGVVVEAGQQQRWPGRASAGRGLGARAWARLQEKTFACVRKTFASIRWTSAPGGGRFSDERSSGADATRRL